MVDHADLIGVPFRYGARGPDAYDCYGLVMEMMRRAGGCLPDFGATVDWRAIANCQGHTAALMGAALAQWEPAPQQAGTVVLMRIGRLVSHVGYLLDDYRMIHAWEGSGGVTVERIDGWQQRIVGFYRHVGQNQ